MKKVKFLLISLMLLFVFSDNVFALCEDEELNDWAEEAQIEAIEDDDMDIYDDSGNLLKTHKKEYHYLVDIGEYNPLYANYRTYYMYKKIDIEKVKAAVKRCNKQILKNLDE